MDVFWTEEEAAFRRSVRARLREGRAAAAAGFAVPSDLGLGERIAFVEEAAWHDPGLGCRLAGRPAGPDPSDPVVGGVIDCALVAGIAGHVFEAGARAARERGAFASSLMGCRELQERLAGLASGAAILGLGTCRLCRLLERGDRTRAGDEIASLLVAAGALAADVRAVATVLLGAPWVAANLPSNGLLPGA